MLDTRRAGRCPPKQRGGFDTPFVFTLYYKQFPRIKGRRKSLPPLSASRFAVASEKEPRG